MSGIVVDVEARTAEAERRLAEINKSLRSIETNTRSVTSSIATAFKGLAAAAITTGTFVGLQKLSTEFSNLNNKIAQVTGRTKELMVVQNELYDIAFKTNSTLQNTVTTYSSMGRALKTMNVDSASLLRVTTAVQQAVALSGSSSESAAAAMVQLGQGLSSGVLRGEELNSILEQTSRLGEALANEFGVTTGQLRKMAEAGKLTSDVVFKALLNQAQAINKEFGVLVPTMEQATGKLGTSIKIFVNEFDKGVGASDFFVKNIIVVSDKIRLASKDAHNMGADLAASFNLIKGAAASIAGPLLSTVKALGQQFGKILPEGFLTRTLSGDVNEAIRIIDQDFLGGTISAIKRFSFINIFSVRSDVEKAIFELKRLSPKYWAAAGWDIPTFKKFFSRENLDAYASAFGKLAKAVAANAFNMGTFIDDLFITLDFRFKQISRYFGFRLDTLLTFKGGQAQTFLYTLGEIIRGISGVSIKVYELRELIQNTVLSGEKAFTNALSDAFEVLPGFIQDTAVSTIRILSGLVKGIRQILLDMVPKIDLGVFFDRSAHFINALYDALDPKSRLDHALDSIRDFSKKVIHAFWQIYEDVIAHSWWTDTIEDVVRTSNSLWDRAAGGLNKFKNNTIDMFKNVFDSNRRMSFDFSDVKNFKFSTDKFKMPKLDTGSFMDSFVDIADKTRNIFKELFASFPSLMKVGMMAVWTTLVLAFFPPGYLKKILIVDALATIAASGSVVAEQFSRTLTGGSFSATVGKTLGNLAGTFFAGLLAELPKLLNVLLGFASSFVQSFVSQLPAIGSILKGVLKTLDFTGLTGPLGLVGVLLFGKGILGIMQQIGILPKSFESLLEIGKKIPLLFGYKQKKNGAGYSIADNFFGALGPARVIGAVGTLLGMMGTFDSLFANSPLAQYAVQGGFLFVTLFGSQGLNTAIDKIGKGFIAPLMAKLRDGFIKDVLPPNLFDAVFKNSNVGKGVGATLGGIMKTTMDTVVKKGVDFALPFVAKGYGLLKTLLLGTDPVATVEKLKQIPKEIFNNITTQIKKITDFVTKGNLFQTLMGKLGGGQGAANGLVSNFSSAFQGLTASFKANMANAEITAAKVGGEHGLVGRAFFGKYGKQVLVGSLLALAAGLSFAGPTQSTLKDSPKAQQAGQFDELFDRWKAFKEDNPITALALQVVGVAIPMMLGALIAFRRQAGALIAAAFDPANVKAYGSAVAGVFSNISKFKLPALVIGVAGAAAYAAQAAGADSMLTIAAAGIAAELAIAFRKELMKVLTFRGIWAVLSKTLGAVFSVAGAWVAGVAATGGLLYLWLFGNKSTFMENLEDAYQKIRKLLGLQPKFEDKERNLSEDNVKFNKEQKLGIDYSLDNIHMSRLSETDKKRLEARIKDLNDTLDAVRERSEDNGDVVSAEDRKAIEAKNRALKNTTGSLAAKSAYDTTDLKKALDESRLLKGTGEFSKENLFTKFAIAIRQTLANLEYSGIENLAEMERDSPLSSKSQKQDAVKRLEELRKRRDTDFNVRYRPSQTDEERNLDKLLGRNKDITFKDNALLEPFFAGLYQRFLKQSEKVARKEQNTFGGRTALPADDPDQWLLNFYTKFVAAMQQRRIAFHEQTDAINKFQSALGGVETQLKSAGIELDTNKLFARDDASFKRIKAIAEEVKELGEQLLRTKNIAERNQIVIRIGEAKVRIGQEEKEAEKASLENPALKLQPRLAALNIPNLPTTETLRKIPEVIAQRIFEQVLDLEKVEERLKVRPPNSIEQFGTDEERRQKPLTQRTAELKQAQLDYANGEVIRDSLRKSIEDSIRIAAKGAMPSLFAKDIGAQLGLDPDLIIKKFAFVGAATIIEDMAKRSQEAEIAFREMADNAVQLKTDLEESKEFLNQPLLSAQELTTVLANIGQQIHNEDLFSLSGSAFGSIGKFVNEIRTLDLLIGQLKGNFDKAKFDDLVTRRMLAAEKAVAKLSDTLTNTPDKINTALQKIGINSNYVLSKTGNLTRAVVAGILAERAKLDQYAKNPNRLEEAQAIAEQQARLDALAEVMTEKQVRSFSEKGSRINSVLDIGLNDFTFVKLGKNMFETMDQVAAYQKVAMSIAGRDGFTAGLVEAVERAEQLLRKSKIVKVFAESFQSIGELATDGIKTQFQKLASAVKDLAFDDVAFGSLSRGKRANITEEATALDALDRIFSENAQFPQLQELASQLMEQNAAPSQILKQLQPLMETLFSGDKGKLDELLGRTVTPMDKMSLALQESTRAIDALTEVIRDSGLGVGRANGGWISGPGSTTSDSIPARLSNGEFVVNASAAGKNKKLLEWINAKKLALGGDVTDAPWHWISADTYNKALDEDEIVKKFPHLADMFKERDIVKDSIKGAFGKHVNLNKLPYDGLHLIDELTRSYLTELTPHTGIKRIEWLNNALLASGDPAMGPQWDSRTNTLKAGWLMSQGNPNKSFAMGMLFHEVGHSVGYTNAQKMLGLNPFKPNDADIAALTGLRRLDYRFNGASLDDIKMFANAFDSDVIEGNLAQQGIKSRPAVDWKKLMLDNASFMEKRYNITPKLLDEIEAWKIGALLNPFEGVGMRTERSGMRALMTYIADANGLDMWGPEGQKIVGKLANAAYLENPSNEAIRKMAPVKLDDVTGYQAGRIDQMSNRIGFTAAMPQMSVPKAPDILTRGLDIAKTAAPAFLKSLKEASKNPKTYLNLAASMGISYATKETLQLTRKFEELADGMTDSPLWLRASVAAGGAVLDEATAMSISGLLGPGGKFFGVGGAMANKAGSLLSRIRIPGFAQGGSIWGAGTSTSDSIPAMLSNGEYVVNAKSASKFRSLLDRINHGPEKFNTGTKRLSPYFDGQSRDYFEDQRSRLNIGYGNFNAAQEIAARAKVLQVEIDYGSALALEGKLKEEIIDASSLAYRAELEYRKVQRENASPEVVAAAKLNAEKTKDTLIKLAELIPKYINKAYEASKEMATTIGSSLTSAVQDLFKGKKSPKEFFKGVLDNVTGSIIDTFVKGLMEPLVNEKDGILTKVFKNIGKGTFELGESIFGGKKDEGFIGPSEQSPSESLSPISGMFDTIKRLFSGDGMFGNIMKLITNMLPKMLSGITGLFSAAAPSIMDAGISAIPMLFAASGGYIRGPGTGISDSIPAMLSNGEFVVNAKATRDNFKYLNAINNGKIKKFAQGGLVTNVPIAMPIETDSKKVSNKDKSNGQTVVNLSITGDISRQTRQEVYQMLPQIASGVNAHNREQGYRG